MGRTCGVAVSHMCVFCVSSFLIMSSKDQTQVVRLMQPALLLAKLSAGQRRILDLRVVQQRPFFKKDNFLSYCFAFLSFFLKRKKRT